MDDGFLWLIIGTLLVLGLVGTAIPFLPGTPLIVAAALVHALATGWTPIGVGRLAILAALSALGYVLHFVAAVLGARGAGGSTWAIAGAFVGWIAGLFLGLPGLVVGPPLGAIAGEVLRSGNLRASIRTGLATFAGLVAGALANIALAVTMIALFLWWLAHG